MERDLTDAIAYARVSTQAQADEGHGLESYLEAFRRYGFQPDQIYWDVNSTGHWDVVAVRSRTGRSIEMLGLD